MLATQGIYETVLCTFGDMVECIVFNLGNSWSLCLYVVCWSQCNVCCVCMLFFVLYDKCIIAD